MESSRLLSRLLVFGFLLLWSQAGCLANGPQFSFAEVKDSLQIRLREQTTLVQTLPTLQAEFEKLKKTTRVSAGELAKETREHAESRFGLGYYYLKSDYSNAEQLTLTKLEQELDNLAPKLEQVFELEAQIRVLQRASK